MQEVGEIGAHGDLVVAHVWVEYVIVTDSVTLHHHDMAQNFVKAKQWSLNPVEELVDLISKAPGIPLTGSAVMGKAWLRNGRK